VAPDQEDPVTDRGSGRPWSNADERKGAGAQVGELKELVVGYAKQETIDPLKTLGRYLGFGLAGSLMLGTGLVLLLLALLRGLQRIELFNDPLEPEGGTWSWVPYGITTVVGVALVALFLMKLMSVNKKRGTR
jgi:hypothetical protein